MKISNYFLHLAWVIALSGMIGSLVMSEIFGWVPCVLCWYQRILLYPLVLLIPIAILRKDSSPEQIILPFSLIGVLIAFYHWLLQIGVISEAVAPCQAGISCITTYINYFGFINIPFLSMLAFGAISLLVYLNKKPRLYFTS
jgi:disulfide bond formation protein DsbB